MSDILTLYPVMTPEREEKLGYVTSELELVYDENYLILFLFFLY